MERPGRGRRGPSVVTVTVGGVSSGFTLADVERTSGGRQLGRCVDVHEQGGENFQLVASNTGGTVLTPLEVASLGLSTRCAGPLDGDISHASPQVRVGSHVRPGDRIDLSGTHTFAAGGLAGTVHSTIALVLGRQEGSNSCSTCSPPPVPQQRTREVSEAFQVASASGDFRAVAHAPGDSSECQLIDACGLTGTVTVPLPRSRPRTTLEAVGPAKRPYRDFLAALGLDPAGNPRGIEVYGTIGWSGGSLAETIDQDGGVCRDRVPTGGDAIQLTIDRHGLVGTYTPGWSLRTRCPGPFLPQFDPTSLATGRVAASALRHRTFTLRLAGSLATNDEGYSVVSHTGMSFVLRRGRLTQHVAVEPGG